MSTSIVDNAGVPVLAIPRPRKAEVRATIKARLRDAQWLTIMRTLGLNQIGLARCLGVNPKTVYASIASALKYEEEQRESGEPTLQAILALSDEEFDTFVRDYSGDSTEGCHPEVKAFFARIGFTKQTIEQIRGTKRRATQARRNRRSF